MGTVSAEAGEAEMVGFNPIALVSIANPLLETLARPDSEKTTSVVYKLGSLRFALLLFGHHCDVTSQDLASSRNKVGVRMKLVFM